MNFSDRIERYVDLWYVFCVKFLLEKVVDPHVQALSFTFIHIFWLKERQVNIGRIDFVRVDLFTVDNSLDQNQLRLLATLHSYSSEFPTLHDHGQACLTA